MVPENDVINVQKSALLGTCPASETDRVTPVYFVPVVSNAWLLVRPGSTYFRELETESQELSSAKQVISLLSQTNWGNCNCEWLTREHKIILPPARWSPAQKLNSIPRQNKIVKLLYLAIYLILFRLTI